MTTQIPPWAHGPAEIFRHADSHLESDGDTDRRIALIGFDNAVEVCVDTYVGLNPRHRGGYQIRREDRPQILHDFSSKLDFVERFTGEKGLDLGLVSIEEILWYHQLRNELYHSGNGMIPERQHVLGARAGARAVFRLLFDCEVVEPDHPHEAPADTAPAETGETGRLAFLGAYIELEKALSARAGPGAPRYTSALWAALVTEEQWAKQHDPTIRSAIDLRNAIVHGLPVSAEGASLDSELSRLAVELRGISREVSDHQVETLRSSSTQIRGRRLAVAAHKAARPLDPKREGIALRAILDAVQLGGASISGKNPARTLYDVLNAAQDLFERSQRGEFRWRDPTDVEGVSGAALLAALVDRCDWINAMPSGRHYQALVTRIEDDGLAVRGPDSGRTMNAALNSPSGHGLFERTGRGTYRCRSARIGVQDSRAGSAN